MDKVIQVKVKYVILLLFVVIFFQFKFCKSDAAKIDKVETTKTTTIEYTENVDSAKVDVSKKKPIKTIDYLIDTISNKARKKPSKKALHKNDSLSKKNTEKVVKANVYKDTITTSNGKAIVKTISTGRVLGLDLTFFTKDKIVTTRESSTITKYIEPNTWFLNVEPKFSVFPNPAIVGLAASVDYTIKNKVRLGMGLEYNTLLPKNNRIIGSFKIGISL